MTTQPLEERVTNLEQEVAEMKQLLTDKQQLPNDDRPWWEKIAGSFADAPTFDEAERFGREWRKSAQDPLEEASSH